MTKSVRWITKAIAFHEAGHLVAAKRVIRNVLCRVNFHIPHESVIVDGRIGKAQASISTEGGAVFVHDRIWHHISWMLEDGYSAEFCAVIKDLGFRNMVMLLAGPYAQARATKKNITNVMSTGGIRDLREVESSAFFISDNLEDYLDSINRADKVAAGVMREHWTAVSAIANAILRGEEVT